MNGVFEAVSLISWMPMWCWGCFIMQGRMVRMKSILKCPDGVMLRHLGNFTVYPASSMLPLNTQSFAVLPTGTDTIQRYSWREYGLLPDVQ